jgi:hypothetical protein
MQVGRGTHLLGNLCNGKENLTETVHDLKKYNYSSMTDILKILVFLIQKHQRDTNFFYYEKLIHPATTTTNIKETLISSAMKNSYILQQ